MRGTKKRVLGLMFAHRAALLAAVAVLMGVAGADAQTDVGSATPAPRPLPAGLSQAGGVVTMQPVDSATDTARTGGESIPAPTSERRASNARTLGAGDLDLYSKAFTAGNRGDWTAARSLADQGRDRVARLVITWRYLLDPNGGASFGEISSFLRDHPEWPLRETLFARAEHAIAQTMAPGAVLSWFGDRKPITGIGKVRLGEALIATGKRDDGRNLIRDAWIEDSFEPSEELAIIRSHGDILTPDVDRQRLDHLLWRNDLTAARREMSRVQADSQRLAQVRMALKTNPRAGERMVDALPQTLRNDPGIIFDRARMLRQAGGSDDVPALLVRTPTREMAKIDPDNWWGELNLAARDAMKGGSYDTAYRLVSDTGLSEGTDFAEAEFMAGWIALRFLQSPDKALGHFRQLAQGVSRPISLGRAYYWAGRAYEAQGDAASAAREYRKAAENPETFYGQLALTRLEPAPRLHLKDTPADPARVRADYEKSDLTRAMAVLADLGEEGMLRLFAVHDVETHPIAGHVELLAEDLVRMGFPDIALRVAKTASYEGIDLLTYSHPLIALPQYKGPGTQPEHALVLGLIRQETEFNPDAVSRVGAVGIMQLMPRTARRMAQLAGLPYRHSDLKTNTHYNMQLGMAELSADLGDWGGSYILAAAAYNAGAGNVKKWIATYGDPRSPGVDPIDWIEQIPFSETRNYVQRVIENTEVYRSRLAGRGEPLQILADLYRPKAPPDTPPLRTPPAPAAPATGPAPQVRPDRADAKDMAVAAKNAPKVTETAALDEGSLPAMPVSRQPETMLPEAAPPVTPSPRPAAMIAPRKRPAH